ncbi:hypothetical protein, partial [Bifidobacterium longum]|uniref:hypothetical protein n=1 Tax=Bifidobacterium longum TaxID=216816 RepID=UPI0025534B5E
MAPCLFPIAVFHCLATENRTRHGPCPFPSRPKSENAQESGRYRSTSALFNIEICSAKKPKNQKGFYTE